MSITNLFTLDDRREGEPEGEYPTIVDYEGPVRRVLQWSSDVEPITVDTSTFVEGSSSVGWYISPSEIRTTGYGFWRNQPDSEVMQLLVRGRTGCTDEEFAQVLQDVRDDLGDELFISLMSSFVTRLLPSS